MPIRHRWSTPLCLAPRPLRPWLTARGSLTARLIAHFPAFNVRVTRQALALAHRDEWHAISLPRPGHKAALREVVLSSGTKPLVFAHSVTPMPALKGGFHLLGRTGSRPLGALLFADPTIRRSPLEWARIDRRHPLWHLARAATGQLPDRLWARRSRFRSGRDWLMVTEVFLPVVHAG
ncbi:chorismate--pyruvate lyase family protein [Chitinibacteraceae bacterium HSL-7]